MNKKVFPWVFGAVASFMLLVAPLGYAQITPQASVSFFGSLNNDLETPNIDVWRVKCNVATAIRGQVQDVEWNDNTFHVTTLCVDPINRRGLGEKEYAVAPGRNPSQTADVSGCVEALVIVECEHNDACDSDYKATLTCTSAAFAPGFPVKKQ